MEHSPERTSAIITKGHVQTLLASEAWQQYFAPFLDRQLKDAQTLTLAALTPEAAWDALTRWKAIQVIVDAPRKALAGAQATIDRANQ